LLEIGEDANDFAVIAGGGVEVVGLVAKLGEAGADVPAMTT
jgi:hypothetical protein